MLAVFLWILAGLAAIALLLSVILSAGIALVLLLWRPLLIFLGVVLVCKLIKKLIQK